MQKKMVVVTALAWVLTAGTVSAQSDHGHGGASGAAPNAAAQQQQDVPSMGPGMMMGQGGMGPGMMGMMRGGMMGQGDMEPCMMMGGGAGMGPGMMMGGMGMGPCGQMGPGMGNINPEDQQKYLDATKELRKQLNDKQFEYAEAVRNPKADKKALLQKRKELWEIQQKIHAKAWEFMTE